MKKYLKVLVIATSRQTRGGITSVVKAHETGNHWAKYECRWIETHRDKNILFKAFYFLRGFCQYLFFLPSYDIVHLHISEPPGTIRKSLFLLCARIMRKKIIVHFHSFSPETTLKSHFRMIYKFVFDNADVILVLSEYWKRMVNEEFSYANKVKVIYNPCIAFISDKQYEKKKQILYAGTVNARKGYADMLAAFANIAVKYPDWSVVFAGNGEIEQGKALAKELGIESQTLFLGWVDGKSKEKAFKEASIFCLPSYAEGFPMAVLDAWAYGLPVIATPVGGLPDIAEDGKNILLFTPGDIDGLVRQLDKMISNPELCCEIAKESLKLSSTTFNIETISRQLDDIYSNKC